MAILHMILPSAKGKRGRVNDTLGTVEKKLIKFKQVKIDISGVSQKSWSRSKGEIERAIIKYIFCCNLRLFI